MIIEPEKDLLLEDAEVALPSEAPPAYEPLGTALTDTKNTISGPPSSPISASSSSSITVTRPHRAPAPEPKGPTAWFVRREARTAREVRETVLALVRTVVRPGTDGAVGAGAEELLENCARTCERHGLAIKRLLTEPSIEGHTAHYWAIVNGRADALEALLRIAPVPEGEMRRACLITDDQALFARLHVPNVSGKDEMLDGRGEPLDAVRISGGQGDAFVAEVSFGVFQKRMRVSGSVSIEFIARGRMWLLSFTVAPAYSGHQAGSWLLTLALLEDSPPTWVDARLVIHALSGQKKAPLTLRLRTGYGGHHDQLVARSSSTGALQGWTGQDRITVSLEKNSTATGLQYAESPYIDPDGTLKARLEASLKPGDTDCVIC